AAVADVRAGGHAEVVVGDVDVAAVGRDGGAVRLGDAVAADDGRDLALLEVYDGDGVRRLVAQVGLAAVRRDDGVERLRPDVDRGDDARLHGARDVEHEHLVTELAGDDHRASVRRNGELHERVRGARHVEELYAFG